MDPDGDVILELSDKKHLRVSSRITALSSKVFAEMLKSQFKEGLSSNRALETPHLISLPDDNVEAFTLLLNVIHYWMDLVPQKPEAPCLENLCYYLR